MFACWFWLDVAFYQMVAYKFFDSLSRSWGRVWVWKPWKLARFTTFGPGWRSMSVATNGAIYWGVIARVWQVEEMCECVAGETMIIAPDIAGANFDMNGLFCKGVLPRGLHPDYILRVNRYSVHTLSITQLLFFVWAVMLACIHHCHAFIIISSMFFTYTHWSWLFQSWSNLASLQDSPHGGP